MPEEDLKKFIRDPGELSVNDLLPERPETGDEVPVILWRLIRIIGFHQLLKEDVSETSYFIGKNIGQMLGIKNTDELLKKLIELKIGKINFVINSPEAVHVNISECVTCSGIKPPLGKPICQLEAGIIAGALETIYPGKKSVGKETKCIGGLGDEFCRIECDII
ncbi:MAG: V4R domain-containing protein [Patescibacteria group bacterium]